MKRNLGCLDGDEPSEHFFRGIELAMLQRFDCVGTYYRYENEAEIFREGDRCESVHLVCSGTVKLFAASREGQRIILRIARPGEILGLPAAMAALPHEVTALAFETCVVKTVRSRAFLNLLSCNATASMRAARILAHEYKAAFIGFQKLAAPTTVAGRVVSLLLDWVRQQNRGTVKRRYCTIPFTHEEIASMTAATRETVTRIFSALKRQQIISVRGAVLTILRPQVLEEFAT